MTSSLDELGMTNKKVSCMMGCMQISEVLERTKIDRKETELLLCHVLKKDQIFLRIHGDRTLSSSELKKFFSLIKRRQKHEPIAYLVGHQPFLGRIFLVNKDTLIPRPETEKLAELVINYLKRQKHGLIMDVGTGSGCLAITLALEFPKSRVIASDVSKKALDIAKKNARRLRAKVKFVKQNLLINSCAKEQIILVANLPYLPSGDKKQMMQDVVKYEPAKALFAGKDGTDLVKKLLQQASAVKVSAIFLEIDPRRSTELQKYAMKLFPEKKVQIKKDLCLKNRFLAVS